MKKYFITKTSVFLLLITLLSVQSLYAEKISKQVEKELDKIGAILEKATLDGDYMTTLKYYTDDIVIMPDFRPSVRGKKALLEQYKKDEEVSVKYHSFDGTIEKRWQHGDQIYERGTFGMALSYEKAKRPMAYYGSYFQIWQKQSNGSYKTAFTIWNLDFNPCE